MAEWRECVFGGVELAGFDRRELRQCLVGGLTEQGHWGKVARFEATPDTCADCPVPALVEAVRVAHLPAKVNAGCFAPEEIPMPARDHAETLAIIEAALALLDRAGEEARDD